MIINTNDPTDFVIIVIRTNLQAIFCYVTPLKPSKLTERFMYVFFDSECTQDFEKHDGSFEHIPILKCA